MVREKVVANLPNFHLRGRSLIQIFFYREIQPQKVENVEKMVPFCEGCISGYVNFWTGYQNFLESSDHELQPFLLRFLKIFGKILRYRQIKKPLIFSIFVEVC